MDISMSLVELPWNVFKTKERATLLLPTIWKGQGWLEVVEPS